MASFIIDYIVYTIIDLLHVKVSGTNNLPNNLEFITIPSTVSYNSTIYTVIEIDNYAFQYSTNLLYIVLPNTLISIGNYSFNGCNNLKSIQIPALVTNIGNNSFQDCNKLIEFIFLGNNIPTFGSNIFYKSTSSFLLNNPITAYYSFNALNTINLSGIFTYTFTTFTVDRVIYAILDSSNVTVINYDSLDISPWNLILNSTVIDPSDMTSYNIIDISLFAFYSSIQLITISIPDSVKNIGEAAFNSCINLTDVLFNGTSTITKIDNYVFDNCSSLINIVIPSSVTSIGYYTFRNCTSLPSITIPNLVTTIGNNTFENCISLSNIIFDTPSQLTTIENYLFIGCTSLSSILLPNSIISIGAFAFRNTGLTSIIIPSSVLYIYDFAFYNNTNLSSVTFAPISNLQIISPNVFGANINLSSIIIPKSVITIGDGAFGSCQSLTNITFETPSSINMLNTNTFNNCFALSNIIIPDSITTIDSGVFVNCYSLINITINNNVTNININAFINCILIQYPINPPPATPIGRLYTNSLPGEVVYDYFLNYALLPPIAPNYFYINYINTNPPIPPTPTPLICISRAINLGTLRGIGSSTRIFNFCERTNGTFYCMSQFNCKNK